MGATTLNEYRKYIEKDAALGAGSSPSPWASPPREATLEILKGLRDKYEAHHRPTITDPRRWRPPWRCPAGTSTTGSCRIRPSI